MDSRAAGGGCLVGFLETTEIPQRPSNWKRKQNPKNIAPKSDTGEVASVWLADWVAFLWYMLW